ncbi:MAG: GvpL/GvpF family gas vesicle protein [Pseudonocardiaceae bacterium]
MTTPSEAEVACYVYGVVPASARLPEQLRGLGTNGRVSLVCAEEIAAVVGEISLGRPLGTRADLTGHEQVLDALVDAGIPIAPMRFGAVVANEHVVTDELLVPHREHFTELLHDLTERAQFTLTGRYEEEPVLREVLEEYPEIHALQGAISELSPEQAYHQQLRLGEMIVGALEEKRQKDGADVIDALTPYAVDVVARAPAQADGVVDAAFLVADERREEFDAAVEDCGHQLAGRVRLRLLGPVPAYDFVSGQ